MNPPNSFEASNNQIPLNIQTFTPKVMNLRGIQFNAYKQYMDKLLLKKNKKFELRKNNLENEDNQDNQEKKSLNLTKELEKQIHELQKLTKEAKEVFILF